MNKIYRLVWNRSLRAPVVASELATRSVSGSSRTQAGPQALTTVLAGAVVALLAIPPDAQAIVGITRKAVDGKTCEANADETNYLWNINDDARCHPAAGTGPSGVGDPGTNIVMYSSGGTTGTEDSIAIGGYLDVWKPASFWGGIDLQGNTISNLKPGEKEGDAATVGQVNKVANDLANIANGGGIKYFRANSDQPDAKATGSHSVAAGPAAEASGNYSTALGSNAKATGDTALAVGEKAEAAGYRSAAFGRTASAVGDRSTAMGLGAKASQADSVALGAYAVADRANTVSVGSATSQRQVVNVAKGTQDTDAVNVSQLKGVTSALGGGAGVAGDGSVTAPSYGIGGKTFNNVGDALGNLDGRVAGNTSAINNINGGAGIKYFRANSGQPDATAKGTDAIAIGPNAVAEAGYSQALGGNAKSGGDTSVAIGDRATTAAAATRAVAIGPSATANAATSVALGAGAVADRANTVSVGAASSQRQVVNVAKGTQDTDAVNVSQLKGVTSALGGGAGVASDGSVTAPRYSVGGKTVNNVGDALTNLGDMITNASADGLVKQDGATRAIAVGKDTNGKKIDLKGTEGERVVTGVADGLIAAGSKDAVTGGQLYNAERATASALGGGAKVNPDGSLAGPAYTVGGKTVNNVGDALSTVDGRVTNVDGRVTQLGDQINNGEIGLVRQDATSRKITVAKDRNGTQVDFTGTAGTRVLNGVSKGAINAASVEAVNGAQLYGTNKTVADSLGGGSKLNPDGSVSGPTYNVGGKSVTNVGDALAAVDGRVTNVDGRVTRLGDQIANGEIGLVQQDATSRKITVAKDRDGTQVDFTGTAGTRVLNGVSKGAINATSVEAVNGAQLYGTNKAMADSLGGGSKLNPDGSVSGPTYNVGGKSVTNVGDAITNLGDLINNVSADGLVKQDLTTRDITVGKDSNGKKIDLKGTEGERVVTGVADGTIGTGSKDAVTGGQLYNAEKATADALGGGAKVNPDGSVSGPTYTVGGKTVNNVGDAITNVDGRVTNVDGRVTQLGDQISNGEIGLVQQDATSRKITVAKDRDGTQVDFAGAAGTRVLNGVSKGAINATSVEAVNGSQLYGTNKAMADSLGGGAKVNPDGSVSGPTYNVGGKTVRNVGDAIDNIDGRVTTIGDTVNTINNGGGIKYFRANSTLADAVASGADSVAIGPQAAASAAGSVALGKGAVADRANTVSVGSATSQRQIVNVAKGTQDTDAVNISQLKGVSDALGGGAQIKPDGTVTGPTYNVGGKSVTNVGDAITNLGDLINNVSADGLVKQDLTTRDITVGKDSNGKKIDLKGTEGERVVTGVADGTIGTGSKDAVTGGQLYNAEKATADALGGGAKVNPDGSVSGPTYTVGGKTVNNVGDAITNVDGRVTNVDGRVTQLGDQISNGEIGLVQQDATSRKITVAKDRDGTQVDFTGTAGSRVLAGVSKGAITATSLEAVNGSQLYGTNKTVADSLGGGSKLNPDGSVTSPTYNVGGKSVTNVGDAITNLGDLINNVSADGLVKQDLTTRDITVGKDSNGKKIDLKGTEGERVVTGVADGTIGTGSKDAVTGGQLYNAEKATADALGGGAKVNPDGSVTGPTYTVGGKTVSSVGDAIDNIDGRVTTIGDTVNTINNGGGIKYFRANSTLADAVASGVDSVAIGPQASASASGSVALGKGAVTDRANTVSVGSASVQRQVVNVAKGTQDTDAVNVSQLKGVTTALGGGAGVGNDGSVLPPSYSVGGKTVSTVGDAITNLGDLINNVSADGLVKQDLTTRDITVGKDSNGKKINLKGTEGERVVTGVADGAIAKESKDAVTGGQLYNAEKATADALGGGAKVNPDGSVTGPTYTVGGKTVNNVGDAITNVDGRVTNVDGRVTQLGDQIANGEIGLVRQDATSRKITVAKDRDGTQVDFTGTAGTRVLNGVSKGAINAASVEGVNGSQLYSTNKTVADSLGGGSKLNPDGSVTGPTYNVGGKSVTNVGDAITNLGDLINNVSADGLIKQDLTTRDITVGKDSNGKKIDLKGTEGERVVAGVASGSVAKDSKDAVNGSQLYDAEKATADALGGGAKVNPDGSVTGPTYNVGGKTVTNVGDAIDNIDGRVTTIGDTVNTINNGGGIKYFRANSTLADAAASGTDSIAIGPQASASASGSVALGKGAVADRANTVSVGSSSVQRQLVNVAKGTQDTDAVNVSQLKGVTTALGGGAGVGNDGSVLPPSYSVGGKTVSNVGDAITNLGDLINNVSADGLVKQDLTTRDITVGKDSNGKKIDLKGTEGERVVTGVADGTIGTGSKDAVTGGQLYNAEKATADALGGGAKVNPDGSVSGPTYTVGGKTVNNVGDAITNVDGRVTNVDGRVTQLGDQISNGEIGLVQQDATSRKITVAKDRDGTQVDFAGAAGTRVLNGVSKGAIAANSLEAVNGSQLYGANKTMADSLGGGSKLNPDGSVSGPTYNVGGKSVTNVGDAITNLGDLINNVSADGLVKQDLTTRDITVGKDSNGKKIDLKGTEGERVVTGVADGTIGTGSKDAVTGGQLYNAEKATADALGGGAKVNPDGSVTGPTYTIGGKTVTSVGDALTEVDGRVTNVDGRVTNLGNQITNGEIGLVKQDPGTKAVTVAKDSGGKQVDLAGTEGERVLTGVARGTVAKDAKDAVNGGQLYDSQKATADALGGGAKVNPDGSVTGPTYTIGGKTMSSVGDALTEVDGRVTNVDARVTQLGDQVNGGKGIKYFRANSSLADALATGMDSVAIGPKAHAQAANAVALGAGAVADRANTVSVGAVGSERQIVNVAKGTQGTDAVNVSQLKGVTDSLGGGAQINPDGSVSGPTYIVGGKTVTNVGDAITRLGDQITNVNGEGLVKQDATSRNIAVAAQTDGKRVDFRGTQGDRVLAGVANGAVGEGSNEAVNGAQLHAVAKSVADGLGGGAQVNPDGSVTGPTYNVGGKTVNNAGDAITNLDGRVTHNTQAIKDITEGKGVKYFHANSSGADSVASGAESVAAGSAAHASGAGSVAVGQGAQAQADNSVALGAGSVADKADTVSVGSAGHERTVSHVAAGRADTDAVNVSQLKNSQAGSIRYDAPAPGAAPDYGTLTLGGPGGTGSTVVRNVAAGKAPTDAVNVQQLQDGMAQTLGKANGYTDSRFQQVKEDAWVARREARGGTAAAMAMAGMPQAYLPGANMLSAGVGSFQGEAAMAVGLSGVTDNGRYVYKAQASGNTSGEFGFSVGAGIQW